MLKGNKRLAMKELQIILLLLILSFYGCNTKKTSNDNQNKLKSDAIAKTKNSTCLAHDHEAYAKLSIKELNEINRSLSATCRENFRSWSYKEPERWKYLSDKFADEVILANPEVCSKKEEIANVFFKHLSQRSAIYFSDAKNKQELMGKSSTEFNYNLSFVIGIEGYQKWQSLSTKEYKKFTQLRDSLLNVIHYSNPKNS